MRLATNYTRVFFRAHLHDYKGAELLLYKWDLEHGEYNLKQSLHIHPQCKYWALFAFIDVAFRAKNPIKPTSTGVIEEQLIK